jgi:hypothetical protein
MYVRERFDSEHTAERAVFDNDFQAIAYNTDRLHRLQSLEVLIRHGDKNYLLSVETWPNHLQRLAIDSKDEIAEANDAVYVVPKEEILPSDLLDLKNTPFSVLQPYLIEQEPAS